MVLAAITTVVTTLATSTSQHIVHAIAPNTARDAKGPPLKVISTLVERHGAYQAETWVLPNESPFDPATLAQLNRWRANQNGGFANLERWMQQHGGVDPDLTGIKLIVAGNRDSPVRIVGMRPVAVCRAPLTGTLLYSPPAGDESTTLVYFNLDRPDVQARTFNDGSVGGPYFDQKTISLKFGEQWVFEVLAGTATRYCEFRLQLTIIEGAKTVTQTVGNGGAGAPFRVSALVNGPNGHPYSAYRNAYLGGVAISPPGDYRRIDPASYADPPLIGYPIAEP
ncbi:hypothetical protein GCM10023196_077780 [Actinoallomurus vinaceus]|uniref:Uncharacterized protein n=1 Tax=Actinoallomurus vinaceus TaxID=1080074 RepID=A0ABP8UNK0_9ACTN